MICPSVTPYGRSNPSFRVFTMDSSSYQLTGYQQYHLNLTLANGMYITIHPSLFLPSLPLYITLPSLFVSLPHFLLPCLPPSLPLEMAAKGEKPKLELAYTTSDLYDLRDLSPASWAGLVERYKTQTHILS